MGERIKENNKIYEITKTKTGYIKKHVGNVFKIKVEYINNIVVAKIFDYLNVFQKIEKDLIFKFSGQEIEVKAVDGVGELEIINDTAEKIEVSVNALNINGGSVII